MQNNIPAVLQVIKFIYDHIMYAELNTKSDYCQVCGWDGEIEIGGPRQADLALPAVREHRPEQDERGAQNLWVGKNWKRPTLKPVKLRGHPESPVSYSGAGNGERDSGTRKHTP